jgi:predicted transposase YbfD/YdcC
MSTVATSSASGLTIFEHFKDLEDPRIERTKKHLLLDIIALAICAVISGADGWEDIEAYGKDKYEWLRGFLRLPNGIPSHDTISRVFRRLNPRGFQDCFLLWIESLNSALGLKLIAIDGKTARHSFDGKSGKNALHLVSAWSVENHLTLGQVAVDSKSNEITAIPELLKILDVHGAIVTIDAMGCQKNIAKEIVEGGGDYILAVKENQPTLCAAIEQHFQKLDEGSIPRLAIRTHVTHDSAHGRTEERQFFMSAIPEEMSDKKQEWHGSNSIGKVISLTTRNGIETSETRYYICSLKPSVKRFGEAVRGHWGIENSCHWVLDMTFDEDQSRIRMDHGTENFALLRRLALSLIKQDTSPESVRRRRKRAGWNDSRLLNILKGRT